MSMTMTMVMIMMMTMKLKLGYLSDVGRAISGQEGVLKGASSTPVVLPNEQYALHIWHIVAYCTYGILLPIAHIPQCNVAYPTCNIAHMHMTFCTLNMFAEHIYINMSYPNLSAILIYQKPEMWICAKSAKSETF